MSRLSVARVCTTIVIAVFAAVSPGKIAAKPADDVKSVTHQLISAIAAGDARAVAGLIDLPASDAGDIGRAIAEVLIASDALADAAAERYGAMARDLAGRMLEPFDAASVDDAIVTVRDDIASVVMPGSVRAMRFRNTDRGWRLVINFEEFLAQGRDGAGRKVELLERTAAVMKEEADHVRAGEYATADAAKRVIERRMHEVIIQHYRSDKSVATTRPAATTQGAGTGS